MINFIQQSRKEKNMDIKLFILVAVFVSIQIHSSHGLPWRGKQWSKVKPVQDMVAKLDSLKTRLPVMLKSPTDTNTYKKMTKIGQDFLEKAKEGPGFCHA